MDATATEGRKAWERFEAGEIMSPGCPRFELVNEEGELIEYAYSLDEVEAFRIYGPRCTRCNGTGTDDNGVTDCPRCHGEGRYARA